MVEIVFFFLNLGLGVGRKVGNGGVVVFWRLVGVRTKKGWFVWRVYEEFKK